MKKTLINITLTLTFAILLSSIYSQNDKINGFELNYKLDDFGNNYTYLDPVDFQQKSPQRSLMWDPLEILSDYLEEDSWEPSITMSSDGTLHVVFCETFPDLPNTHHQRIVYRSKSINGIWSDPLIVDQFSGIPPRNCHKPNIAVSDNGDIHIVFHRSVWDGNGLSQIAYSNYDSQADEWSTEPISGDSGTVSATLSGYPDIILVSGNPVVTWGNDCRNGTNESFIVYLKDQDWTDPILVSSIESTRSDCARIVKMSSDKVFISFHEYNIAWDSLAIYYRILQISDGSLSEIFKIKDTDRERGNNLFSFDICSLTENQLFLALNSKDTLYTYNFNISNQTFVKNPEILVTNLSTSINYNLPSICSDTYNRVHIVYNAWNNFNLYHVTYEEDEGFSEPISITTNSTSKDFPQIIYGTDGFLHLIFSDNRFDFNGDPHLDREVFYTKQDISAGNEIFEEVESISCYPNPTNDKLVVSCSERISDIVIFDLEGNIIYKNLNIDDNNIAINLRSKVKGMYFARIITDKNIFTQKIIKK